MLVSGNIRLESRTTDGSFSSVSRSIHHRINSLSAGVLQIGMYLIRCRGETGFPSRSKTVIGSCGNRMNYMWISESGQQPCEDLPTPRFFLIFPPCLFACTSHVHSDCSGRCRSIIESEHDIPRLEMKRPFDQGFVKYVKLTMKHASTDQMECSTVLLVTAISTTPLQRLQPTAGSLRAAILRAHGFQRRVSVYIKGRERASGP
jgi:hypothetical protein